VLDELVSSGGLLISAATAGQPQRCPSHQERPSLPSFKNWTARKWQLEEDVITVSLDMPSHGFIVTQEPTAHRASKFQKLDSEKLAAVKAELWRKTASLCRRTCSLMAVCVASIPKLCS
jgi:hypothetical protein